MIKEYRVNYDSYKQDTNYINLDIGCGTKKQPGYVGIDIADYGQEIVWDITKGFPLKDNSVDAIYSSHCLEHFTMPELEQILWEILRICHNGSTVKIEVPHGDTIGGHFPCHYVHWNETLAVAISKWLPESDGRAFEHIEIKRVFDCLHIHYKVVKTK